MDLNRILFVSKGKQLDQCMCVCVHGLLGSVYQRVKSRRSRPSLNKLINCPFVRPGTGPNKIKIKENRSRSEIIVGERRRQQDSKQREKESLSWA